MKIKAILFDSGRVLNFPKTGNWFIPSDFFQAVNRESFRKIPRYRKNQAFHRACAYLDSKKRIVNREQELQLFKAYYRILSKELPELNLNAQKADYLAQNLVFSPAKYQFYDDALPVLKKLSVEYKLAVVSDAWPSLEGVFEKAGMRKYFSSFVISSLLGTVKPDSVMYQTALNELGVSAQEALFVDDQAKSCKGAARLGIHAVLLCRGKARYMFYRLTEFLRNYKVINNLIQINWVLKRVEQR